MYSDHSKESFRRIATQLQIQTQRLTSLAQSIVLIGCCNANTSTGRRRDLTCDSPFKGRPCWQYNTHTLQRHTQTHMPIDSFIQAHAKIFQYLQKFTMPLSLLLTPTSSVSENLRGAVKNKKNCKTQSSSLVCLLGYKSGSRGLKSAFSWTPASTMIV